MRKDLWTQDIYTKTFDFAARAHKDQKYPGKEYSYIFHLANVCMEVMTAIAVKGTDNPDLAIQCALLHDTIEDTDTTFDDIVHVFGEQVAVGVLALTKNMELEKEQQMQDSLERILQCPREIGMVKLADRISNLQKPPYYWKKDKIWNYQQDAVLIHRKLQNCNAYLADRLALKIKEYEAYIDS